MDELQEAVDSTANTIKLTLPGKVELQMSVWSCGTPDPFIMHVEQAINVIKQKGLKEAYEKFVGNKKGCTSILRGTAKPQDFPKQSRGRLHPSQGCKDGHRGA